jgi:hypothetical protein
VRPRTRNLIAQKAGKVLRERATKARKRRKALDQSAKRETSIHLADRDRLAPTKV